MKILIIFLSLFFFSFGSILSDRIQSKMNYICYYASIVDGSNDGSMPQSAYSGEESGRRLVQTITSHRIEDAEFYTCDEWNLDPYVNIDTETLGVTAYTSCSVYSKETGTEENPQTTYYRDIKQSAISVDCSSGCEIPKDSHGNNYELNKRIYESECNIDTLNRLYRENNPTSSYSVIDASYLDCDASTPSATGCYYLMGFEGFSENNETNTSSNDNNTTPVTDEIKKTNEALKKNTNAITSMKNELKNKLDEQKQSIQGLDNRLQDIKNAIEASARKISASEINTTIAIMDMHTTLKHMDKILHTDFNNTDINDSLLGIVDDMNATFKRMNDEKDSILTMFNHFTSPTFIGTGEHVFTADIFNGSVSLDLLIIEQLRQYFDILWILLLAYFNYKLYFYILTELLRKL